jgi:hypothetical protein
VFEGKTLFRHHEEKERTFQKERLFYASAGSCEGGESIGYSKNQDEVRRAQTK